MAARMHFTPPLTSEQRAALSAFFDNLKSSVMGLAEQGQVITLHTHNEWMPMGAGPLADAVVTGSTVAVSVGAYPAKIAGLKLR